MIRLKECSLINMMQIKSCKFGIEGKGVFRKIHLEKVVQMCRVQTTRAQIKKLQREGTAVEPYKRIAKRKAGRISHRQKKREECLKRCEGETLPNKSPPFGS